MTETQIEPIDNYPPLSQRDIRRIVQSARISSGRLTPGEHKFTYGLAIRIRNLDRLSQDQDLELSPKQNKWLTDINIKKLNVILTEEKPAP